MADAKATWHRIEDLARRAEYNGWLHHITVAVATLTDLSRHGPTAKIFMPLDDLDQRLDITGLVRPLVPYPAPPTPPPPPPAPPYVPQLIDLDELVALYPGRDRLPEGVAEHNGWSQERAEEEFRQARERARAAELARLREQAKAAMPRWRTFFNRD